MFVPQLQGVSKIDQKSQLSPPVTPTFVHNARIDIESLIEFPFTAKITVHKSFLRKLKIVIFGLFILKRSSVRILMLFGRCFNPQASVMISKKKITKIYRHLKTHILVILTQTYMKNADSRLYFNVARYSSLSLLCHTIFSHPQNF